MTFVQQCRISLTFSCILVVNFISSTFYIHIKSFGPGQGKKSKDGTFE